MLFCRERNARSGVTLAMCHRLRGISIYGLSGLSKRDEHQAYTLIGVWHPLAYYQFTAALTAVFQLNPS